MLPPASLNLRHQRRNMFAAPKMPTFVPCGKSLRGTRKFRPGTRKRSSPTPGKPGEGSHLVPDDNSTTQTPAAAHPIGWMHGQDPASRAKTPRILPDPRAEDPRATSPPPVASGVHHRNTNPLEPNEPRQAKARQAWAGRALLRSTNVDGASR